MVDSFRSQWNCCAEGHDQRLLGAVSGHGQTRGSDSWPLCTTSKQKIQNYYMANGKIENLSQSVWKHCNFVLSSCAYMKANSWFGLVWNMYSIVMRLSIRLKHNLKPVNVMFEVSSIEHRSVSRRSFSPNLCAIGAWTMSPTRLPTWRWEIRRLRPPGTRTRQKKSRIERNVFLRQVL